MVEIVHSVDEAEISTLVLFATSFRHGYEMIESILPPTPDREARERDCTDGDHSSAFLSKVFLSGFRITKMVFLGTGVTSKSGHWQSMKYTYMFFPLSPL